MYRALFTPKVIKRCKLHPTLMKKAANALLEEDDEKRKASKKKQQKIIDVGGQCILIFYKYEDDICKINEMRPSRKKGDWHGG